MHQGLDDLNESQVHLQELCALWCFTTLIHVTVLVLYVCEVERYLY